VNERTAEMSDETEKPQNQQNDKDSPKHMMFSFELVSFASREGAQVRLKIFENPVGGLVGGE
jgi:hypothetical protein